MNKIPTEIPKILWHLCTCKYLERCFSLRQQYFDAEDEIMADGVTRVTHYGLHTVAFRKCIARHLGCNDLVEAESQAEWCIANVHLPKQLLEKE